MAIQLIFVVETDRKSRSDYIYIRSVLEKWYGLSTLNDVKINSIFMNGKGNFSKKKVISEIETLTKNYSNIGKTHTIFCFDTDKFDSDPNDQKVLSEEEQFCKDNGFDFVWFCHDIEEVFTGQSIANNQKTDRARQYAANNDIENINRDILNATTISKGKSNIITVIDRYLTAK